MRRIRALVGLSSWLIIAALIARFAICESNGPRAETLRKLVPFWSAARSRTTIEFPLPVELAVGDPIFVTSEEGGLQQIGEVRSLGRPEATLPWQRASVTSAQILLYPTAPTCGPGTELTYFTTPSSIAWVTRTLLTPEKTSIITRELQDSYQENR